MEPEHLFIIELLKIFSASVVSCVASYFVYKGVSGKVDNLHHEINNKMDRLLTAEKAVSKQEGKEEAIGSPSA